MRHKAPVLPVGIIGAEKVKGFAWLLHRPKVTVNVGPTFCLKQIEAKITTEEIDRATGLIMSQIAGLLPPRYRGEYTTEAI